MTKDDKENFVDSYIVPSNIRVDDFYNGRYYYVTGLKGTGKTALIRYVGIRGEEDINAFCSFILFKSDYDRYDKEVLERAISSTIVYKPTESPKLEEEVDFEAIWKWIIHRHIAKTISENNLNVFKKTIARDEYLEFVMSPELNKEVNKLKRFIPTLKEGTFEVRAQIPGNLEAKLGVNFDFDNTYKNKENIHLLSKKADALFSLLEKVEESNPLFIFIDELELSYESHKSYRRDVLMIRDLITVVYKMNMMFQSYGLDMKVICGVRTEVLSAVEMAGKEINKYIDSYGFPIAWNQPGALNLDHPLIDIMTTKILISEKSVGNSIIPKDKLWGKWFPPKVNNLATEAYILNNTWYRPRDIIRLLTIAQTKFPEKTNFDQIVFDQIRKEYSTQSWREMTEELSASFSKDEIAAIKAMLYGFKRHFTYKEIENNIKQKLEKHNTKGYKSIFDKLSEVLAKLYRIGILGNSKPSGEQRWASRGDDELIINDSFDLTVHRALWPYLSLFHESSNHNNSKIIDKSIHCGKVFYVNKIQGFAFINCDTYNKVFAPFRNFKEKDKEHINIGKTFAFNVKAPKKSNNSNKGKKLSPTAINLVRWNE